MTKPTPEQQLQRWHIAGWSLFFWGLIWIIAPWLNRPIEQPIFNDWVLNGSGLASFPMWGYSLLIRLLGSVTAVVVLQSLLVAVASAMLMVRLLLLVPRLRGLIIALFMCALPWWSYAAFAYQVPISSSCMVLGILAADQALRTGRSGWGVVAGGLFGLGQNFRTEWLLFPGGILVVFYTLKQLKVLQVRSVKPLVLAAAVALLLQIPWGLNCWYHAGRFSLSESNFGHVAFLSLGALADNPWKIEASDAFAKVTVANAGLGTSSFSFEGGDYLKHKFFENVKLHPLAVAEAFAVRVGYTVLHPFSSIKPTAAAAEPHSMKEFRKAFLGVKTAEGWPRMLQMCTLLLLGILVHVLICAVSILGLFGLFLAVRRGPFYFREPLILCLGLIMMYRFGLNVVLFAGGKYMTGVYLCYLPFVANALSHLWQSRAAIQASAAHFNYDSNNQDSP
jgi:hypothetical protein